MENTTDKDYDEFLTFVHSESAVTEEYTTSNPKNDDDVESGSKTVLNGDRVRRTSSIGLSRRASTTETRRNPFAIREGHALIFSNINMTLVRVGIIYLCNCYFFVAVKLYLIPYTMFTCCISINMNCKRITRMGRGSF